MKAEAHEPSTREHWRMSRVVRVMRVLFWASATLTVVLVMLSWFVAGAREAWSFNLFGGISVGLVMISSAFLFWQELRTNRQEMRAAWRESRDICIEEGDEWSPKAWLYATAFGFAFALAWYLLPHLFLV